ncbi:MAG: glycosyltransferase family 2 protein [Bacteroidales bacterium]
MPLISHIICTYNRAEYLPKALEALAHQNYPDYNDFEVVIINNNSTDNTQEIVDSFIKQYPDVKVVYAHEKKQGLSNARNKAIEVSNADWLAFLDDDAYVDADYTLNLVNFIKSTPTIKAIGGPILLDFESPIPTWYTHYLGSLFGYFKPYSTSRYFSKNFYPRGSNMIFHKTLFKKYGIFNPNLGRIGRNMMGSEEKDMFQRIYNGNELVYYLHTAVIYHLVPDFRTEIDFVKKQSIGVGLSEHVRILQSNSGVFSKIISEVLKWSVSFILLAFYTLQLKPTKGIMLIRFRYWVLKGLTTKIELE